jgi:WD40 repeat protein
MDEDVLRRFEGLWGQAAPPDVWQFLADAGPLAPADVAALLTIDRDHRWRRGERIHAEIYLERCPELAAAPDPAVHLIYSEYWLRRSLGERPDADEYLRRFPRYAGPLTRRFEVAADVDRLMAARTVAGGPDAPDAAPPPDAPAPPGYEVLEKLGQGGMGVVYKAWQAGFKRFVALKVLRDADLASPEELARFRTEAEAVARSPHPNIVQVYDVGECQGRPFYILEFCPGGSLDRKLNGKPEPPRAAAALAETLARAVHAAHLQKVVHRDLKPANVLLAADGTPKVADFGLAKQLDAAGHTATGRELGTASYMAPEQAAGKSKDVGPACDVYALGAILFECLTGRPPFQAPTRMETLLLVLGQAPPRPRLLQPGTPRDLETICLKCLEKDPRRRYASALELADDLRRFLDGRPVRARPAPAWERAWRWCRRNPAPAALGAAVVATLLAGVAVASYFALAAAAEAAAKGQALRESDENLYLARLGQTQLAWEDGRIDDMRSLLELQKPQHTGGEDRRGFEWYFWDRVCRRERRGLDFRHGYEVAAVAFLDGGTLLSATAQGDRPVEVRAWDPDGGPVQAPGVTLRAGGVVAAAFSPDGGRLATAGWSVDERGTDVGAVTVWDRASGATAAGLTWDGKYATAVAFSPDGAALAAGDDDGWVRVWALPVADKACPHWKFSLGQPVAALAFAPNGRLAAAGKGGVQLWDRDGSAPRWAASVPKSGSVTRLAFTNAAALLAAGRADGVVQLWDAETGADRGALSDAATAAPVTALAFARDGAALAAGYEDHTVRRWDVAARAPTETLVGHSGPVAAVAFRPDDAVLATGGRDKAVKVWDLRPTPPDCIPRAHDGLVHRVAWAPGGKLFASAGQDGCVYLWDAATCQKCPPWPAKLPGREEVHALAFSPDGRWLAAGGEDRAVRLWDLSKGAEAASRTLAGECGGVLSVAFSPDGAALAVGDMGGGVRLYALPGLEELDHDQCDKQVYQVTFSARGFLAAAGRDGTVRLWDAAGGRLKAAAAPWETGPVYCAAFSPDGALLAAGADDHEVKLWDMDAMRPLEPLRGHTGRVWDVAFSPDGRTLASAGADATIKLWGLRPRRQLVATLRGHAAKVQCLAFAPPTGADNRSPALLSGDWGGAIRVWRASPGGK